jgi:hypothetical protein
MATNEAFDRFLNQAWAGHADDAEGWAQRLRTDTPAPNSVPQLLALVRFTTHLLAEHLGRYDDARWRLSALAAHPQADASVQAAIRIAAASLSLAEHGSAAIAVFKVDDQIRALAQAAAIAVGQRQLARALALLERARVALGMVHNTDAALVRPLAVACNNIAWELHDLGAQRTPEATAAMLEIAAASRVHWAKAGSWLEVERADYCLALTHLAAGELDTAATHAQACLQACQANVAPALEYVYAHEAQARVAAAQQKVASVQAHVLHAQAAFDKLSTDDQAACRGTLDSLRLLAGAAATAATAQA